MDVKEAGLPEVLDEPIGYTESPMDQEMNFPNPVERTDLPTRRRRWPKVVAAGGVFVALLLVFLPQILSSKVGRKFVVSYISSKTNGSVTLESFKTSWFGGSSVHFLSIHDPMNRTMGCKSLTCKASLWSLLRGKYNLGETTIEGLHVDYVVDDGRGADSFDIMKGAAGVATGGSSGPLPVLSGKITINSGTIVLHRGTVQPKLYNVTWQQAKLENLDATFDIASLAKPWTFSVSADTVEENTADRGTISSTGTVELGTMERVDPKRLKLDINLTGENVRTGNLLATLIASATPDDVRQALGPVLGKVDVVIKGADGRLVFERCDAAGAKTQIHLKPTIDIAATPAVLGIVSEPAAGTISMGVSKRLAEEWLVYLNPFLREAVDGQGSVTLTFDQLQWPLARQWQRGMTARGRVAVRGAVLDRSDEMTAAQQLPGNIASQLALLTGDAEKTVRLEMDGNFVAGNGAVAVSAMRSNLSGTTLVLDGSTELESGNLKLLATVENSPGISSRLQGAVPATPLAIPIGGTIREPHVGVFALKGELSDASLKNLNDGINEQITRMRAKDTQRLMQKSQNTVQEILRPLQPPATAPGK
jgi:hypothetical protein